MFNTAYGAQERAAVLAKLTTAVCVPGSPRLASLWVWWELGLIFWEVISSS